MNLIGRRNGRTRDGHVGETCQEKGGVNDD